MHRGRGRSHWRGVWGVLFGWVFLGSADAAPPNHEVTSQPFRASYGSLPLTFEANRGQAPGEVAFLAHGPGYTVATTPGGMLLALAPPRTIGSDAPVQSRVVRVHFDGANPAAPVGGVDELPSKSNYLIGSDPAQWRTGVPQYRRVSYSDLYPGIDLVYYGNQRQLEYDFIVGAGADPRQIRLSFAGLSGGRTDPPPLRVDQSGRLVLRVDGGEIAFDAPVAYQIVDGERRAVAARFAIAAAGAERARVEFALGHYDTTLPLIIDPVLVYSGYLGGNSVERAGGLAVDSAGNAYVTGYTYSLNFDTHLPLFPTNRYPPTGGSDPTTTSFVAKLNAAGDALVYSTYLGGSQLRAGCFSGDEGADIAVDGDGNAYIGGGTCALDFPAAQNSPNGGTGSDAFVAKLNAAGNALIFSRYLGGAPQHDRAVSIAVDPAGDAYVGGITVGPGDFPTTAGAWQPQRKVIPTEGIVIDGFAAKLSSNGALLWSTYVSGTDIDVVEGVALDRQNPPNVYLSGDTTSEDFPTTPGSFDHNNDDQSIDTFVVKLSSSGTPVYSTYFGGSGRDETADIAASPDGRAYLIGQTDSKDLPPLGSIQPFDSTLGSNATGFLAVFSENGAALRYWTYLEGGTFGSFLRGVAVGADGVGCVTGATSAPDYPVRDAIQSADGVNCPGGICFGGAAVVSCVRPDGLGLADLVFSTYLAGSKADSGMDIAIDAAGSLYILGNTESTDFSPGRLPGTGQERRSRRSLHHQDRPRAARPDGDVHALADGHPYADGDGYVHAFADGVVDADANPVEHFDLDKDLDQNGDPDADGDSDPHADADPVTNGHPHPDAHADPSTVWQRATR